jgi:hypothetical protein
VDLLRLLTAAQHEGMWERRLLLLLLHGGEKYPSLLGGAFRLREMSVSVEESHASCRCIRGVPLSFMRSDQTKLISVVVVIAGVYRLRSLLLRPADIDNVGRSRLWMRGQSNAG